MIFKIARFEVKPDQREAAEKAMAEFAEFVGAQLEGSDWATYREKQNPNRYVSIISIVDARSEDWHRRAPGTRRFTDALYPALVGEVQFTEYELVATSEP
jgi:quinol monooxygenase YgiN